MYQSGGELHCVWENVSQVEVGNLLDSSQQLLISSKERGQLFGGSGRVEWAIWTYQQSTAYGKRENMISLNICMCGTIDGIVCRCE